jgi:hypothetical protein
MEKKIKELSCKTLLVDVSEYPLNFLIFPHRLTANVPCKHLIAYRIYRKPEKVNLPIACQIKNALWHSYKRTKKV